MTLLLYLLAFPFAIIYIIILYFYHLSDKKKRQKALDEEARARKEMAADIAEYFKRVGWERWSSIGYLSDAELRRIKRAKSSANMRLMSCGGDRVYVHGSGLEGYRIEDLGCSCPDFDKRYLPCKHMYFLVFKLVGDHPDDDVNNMQKLFSSMSGWDQWDPDIHKNPEQFVRLRLSMIDNRLSVMCYDPKYKLAKVLDTTYPSSNDKGQIHLASYDHCDCGDFRRRRFPCKHMYALAAALDGDVSKCILDYEHPPLHGIKFTLAGHFPRKSKDYIGVREELASLSGNFSDELPYYAASAILLGSDPSEGRQAMVKESGLEVFTLESVREIFSGETLQNT